MSSLGVAGGPRHRPRSRRPPARVTAIVTATLVSAGALGGCAGHPAEDDTRERSDRALVVMMRGPEVSANSAAARVVGGNPTQGIVALSASGTNRDGKLVLQIRSTASVSQIGGSSSETAVRCYAYDFTALWARAGQGLGHAELVDCPSGPPVAVTPEAPETNPMPGG